MIEQALFGTLVNGEAVTQYTLSNDSGMRVTVLSLGGIIQKWLLPDGKTDIVLGFDNVEEYLADQGYLGATVGRYANRIADGKFSLNSTPQQVSTNLDGNSLHGGEYGFHRRNWQASIISNGNEPALKLSLTSPDGDQGFPGNLDTSVTFTLIDNTLKLEYTANCDKDTVFNPTQHSYFNLAGHQSGSILHNQIQVLAEHYTPANNKAIPTGEIRSVHGTHFDLQQFQTLNTLVNLDVEEIKQAGGLDHNWCLTGFAQPQQHPFIAAVLVDPNSGRKLTTATTMPGIQIYSGNFIGKHPIGKGGQTYDQYFGVCLETQFYPDSPNNPHFPSATLTTGQRFYSQTTYTIEEI